MALRKFLYMDQTEGYHAEQAAADELSLGKITYTGVGGVAIDAGGFLISNVATPVSASDAANKSYVDNFAQGVAWKNPVRASTTAALPAGTYANGASGVGATFTETANGALPAQDGVTLVNGDRLLVKNQAAGLQNGIYVVTDVGSAGTPFILTRATDADTSTELLQAAVFIEEGTTNADSAWVDTTDAPITVGTTTITFVQFSSTVAYTFDQGLSLTAGSVKVELDTGANAQGAGAGGGSSGLEFDVNTSAGKLRAAVNATGGLDRTASGLAVLNDPQANTAANNPSLSSSATGELVVRAPKVEENYTAAEAFAVGDPVAWSTATNDKLVKGLANTDAKSRIIGVARTLSTANNDTAAVVIAGVCTGAITGATVGTPYYLAAAGGLTTTLPGSSNRVVQCGIAKNATDLFVRIIDYGKKA